VSSSQDFLGPYRLIRLVRAGRRCGVWEAVRQGETDRLALKVLLEEHKGKAEEIEQLKNEARIGKLLDHPDVIRIHDFVGAHRLPFLVMQLFAAKNLKQELRERPDFVAVNIPHYVRKCASGLGHLHERGWIHRDVKPENFLVDEQGGVKLIDFSIAVPAKTTGGLTRLFGGMGRRTIQGTRSYMSPEQIRNQRLTPASDVYGFGCVLHELLAGKPPFTATTANELLSKHLHAAVPSVQAYNRNVSEAFANLVARMLSKEPTKRPQSMREFLAEFDRINVYRAGGRPRLASS
jgi:serine/threonine-protein kinase